MNELETIFKSECRIDPFTTLLIRRDGDNYHYEIITDGEPPIKITLCKPQTVKLALALMGDAILYKGEIEQIK